MARGGQVEQPVMIVPAGAERAASDPDRTPAESERAGSVHPLGKGRTLALVPASGHAGAEAVEAIEIRAQSGTLELRVRITDEGPVLEMQGIKLAVTAAEDIALKSRRVLVEAEEGLTLASRGQARLLAKDRIEVRSSEYLGLDGKLVGLRSDERAVVRELADREFGGDVEQCLKWLAAQAPAVDW